MFLTVLPVSLSLVAYVSAQSLSSQCTSTLTSIASNADVAACLTPSPLVSLFLGGSNTSVIGPVNNWLTSVCASQSCSNDTLAAIVKNATTGCATELGALGYNSNTSNDQVAAAVQHYYPMVRKIACLKDTSDNGGTNCITQTLTNYEKVLGTLSIDNIISLFANGPRQGTNVPANLSCTDCIKAAYNIGKQDAPELFATSGTQETLQAQCGASFTDGNNPSEIFQSAASDKEVKGSSGSLSLVGRLRGVWSMACLLSLFCAVVCLI